MTDFEIVVVVVGVIFVIVFAIIPFIVVPLIVPGNWSMFTTTDQSFGPYREKLVEEYLKAMEEQDD